MIWPVQGFFGLNLSPGLAAKAEIYASVPFGEGLFFITGFNPVFGRVAPVIWTFDQPFKIGVAHDVGQGPPHIFHMVRGKAKFSPVFEHFGKLVEHLGLDKSPLVMA